MSDHVSLPHVPFAAGPLTVGLLLNSTILFGNIALSLVGPAPIVLAVVISTIVHFLAAYLTYSPLIRNLSLNAGLATFTLIPHSVIFCVPVMQRLLQLNREPTFSEAEEKEAEACLRMWARRHRWRSIEYVIGWTAGMAAVLALVERW
ncbi:uncharacterized protein MKK02DRAFT_42527 [Dioszegia hungarica]|uniref:DUF1772-domain-containing protein n=1 Tax=Dioszegia hungarica TaxID=4972 RepID=A0AA38HBF8_9TREE|nr:uncharacterized protein MKK02DRAFT_42527 [Dioszegia hungarica]KAI9638138.1 hypothetical protein MKK02DRAFT_42527 [Dioszegia hungarica]